jgi:hypothetical protein
MNKLFLFLAAIVASLCLFFGAGAAARAEEPNRAPISVVAEDARERVCLVVIERFEDNKLAPRFAALKTISSAQEVQVMTGTVGQRYRLIVSDLTTQRVYRRTVTLTNAGFRLSLAPITGATDAERVAQLTGENTTLRTQLEASTATNAAYALEMLAMLQQLAALNTQLTTSESAAASLQQQVIGLTGELAQSRATVAALQEQNTLLANQVLQLQGGGASMQSEPLRAVRNESFIAPVYTGGTSGVRIASFLFSASAAQGTSTSALSLGVFGGELQNVRVVAGGTQFGATQSVASSLMTFSSGQPLVIPAGGSTVVDVYADILASTTPGAYPGVVRILGWNSVGVVSGSSLQLTNNVHGQDLRVGFGPVVTLATDVSAPPASQVGMGTTSRTVHAVRVTANHVDDLAMNEFNVALEVSGGASSLAHSESYELFDGARRVAGPASAVMYSSSYGRVRFTLAAPVVIAKNTSKVFTVRTGIPTFASGGAVSGASIRYVTNNEDLAIYSVASASQPVSVVGEAKSAALTIYRTTLGAKAYLLGSSVGRARMASDGVALLRFTTGTDAVTVQSVAVTCSGGAVKDGGNAFMAFLRNPLTGSFTWGGSDAVMLVPGPGDQATGTFNLSTGVLGPGSTFDVSFFVDSSNFANAADAADGFTVKFTVLWSDGTSRDIPLELSQQPLGVSVTY